MTRPILAPLLLSLLLAACPDDPPDPSASTSTDTTTTADPPHPEPQGVDTTAGSPDATCLDDYPGHHALLDALALGLDTSDNAVITLGDGALAMPIEIGDDALAVCTSAPSDFFSLQAQCAGFLTVEVRALEGGVPELLLHDDAGQLVAQAVGDWEGFFLKPLQWHVEAGTHVIEIRHAGNGPQRYALTVIMLPGPTCGP